MNPLSSLTYYRRHKGSTLLLLILISLMTLGVSVMVRLPDSLLEHMYHSESYVTRASLVSALGSSLDPSLVSLIRSHPDVARVIQERGLQITLPPISGGFHWSGVSEADAPILLEVLGLRLKEGRLPQARTNELALSEAMAKGMGVWIGDEISRSLGDSGENWYAAIPVPLVVVGILEDGDSSPEPSPPLGLVSYEYVDSHELFRPFWSRGLIVVARPGREAMINEFLGSEIAPHAQVRTHRQLIEKLARVSRSFHLIFGVVDILVAAAIALVVGIINQLAQSRRLTEFGMLHAVGYDKGRLIRRLTLETAVVAAIGWLFGLLLSWGFFYLLKTKLYEPHGIDLGLSSLTPIWFSIPVPLAAIVFTVWSTMRTFARLDAVAIIEQDKLNMEAKDRQEAADRSLTRPLSSLTFYLRHRRRGLALVVTMGLMILGVAFPAFVFAPMLDTMVIVFEHLRQVSVVSPTTETTIDPGVMAQIKGHPDVAETMPAIGLQTEVNVPPMAHPSIFLYGVNEGDLQTLLNLYGAQVAEGRLPRPRTNEIVLSQALAQNRNLQVGDRIGRVHYPEEDDDIPTEMIIVGILSTPPGREDLWTGFASLEYLQNHEFYASWPMRLLVVPVEGHKEALDTWLVENVDSKQAVVQTLEDRQTTYRIAMAAILVLFGLLESVIAIVAAVALGILSYTFFVQRQGEFGILHAIGHSRPWLVLRTVRESASVVAVAWLLGGVLCAVGLIYMQIGLYAPKGLSLNLLNPAPWLFTLPMPLAIIAVGAGLVARMLRKLDPVAVIERRS
jgi:ABC-type antimicrobial peptide transport system permease subunit